MIAAWPPMFARLELYIEIISKQTLMDFSGAA